MSTGYWPNRPELRFNTTPNVASLARLTTNEQKAQGKTYDNGYNFVSSVVAIADPLSLLDYQNRVGSKFGGGGVAGASETNVDRRERLRKLALETIDLAKDPYILRNHLGSLECRLCLTLHTNEGSYLAHTQGKKHQTNLARRAARDAKETQLMVAPAQSNVQRKVFLKIGRPGYRVTKVRDRDTGKEGMMVQVHLPQIKPGVTPRRRFMSAWEQKREPPNKAYQYLIVAAEPYETIAFRIPAREIEDESDDAGYWNWSHWDPDTKQYTFQFMFRMSY